MKSNTIKELVLIILSLIPMAYLAYVWPQLAPTVPTHFNISGEPNGYSSKNTLLWLMISINGFVYLLLKAIPKIDPRFRKADDPSNSFVKIRIGVSLLICALTCLIVNAALYGRINGNHHLLSIVLALFFAFLGYNLVDLKPNYFIGVRTPWTLENEVVWRKTHQFTGRVWFFGSIVLLPLIFIFPEGMSMKMIVGFILFTAFISLVYSYILYKQETKKPLK